MINFASKMGARASAWWKSRLKSYLPAIAMIGAAGAAAAMPPSTAQQGPSPLELAAPIERWDEALPLGNGMLGGLLWGSGNQINLSLDRGDLWDERRPEVTQLPEWNYQTIRDLVAAGNQAEISRLFDAPYHEKTPTKLPGGRLVLRLDSQLQAQQFALNLQKAMATVNFAGGDEGRAAANKQAQLQCFFSATQPVAMLRLPAGAAEIEIIRPQGLDQLGYDPANFGHRRHKLGEGEDAAAIDLWWMHQLAAQGLEYAIVVGRIVHAGEVELAVTVTSNSDGGAPLEEGRGLVVAALQRGFDSIGAPHEQWWRKFWQTSSVELPEPALQQHYDLVKYYYGAASRVGAPPMPLQGVWTRDDGNLPPWKGDFHNDLNTQMTYLAVHAAGLHEAGQSFLDYQWQLLPNYQKFARDFYGVQGAVVPGVATLNGSALGGWSQYSLSPTQGMWVGHSFYMHWRYSRDRKFLRERAYPWLKEIGTSVAQLLEDKSGVLYLPLSTSPEIHNNSIRAWLKPNSNYDLDLMRWGFAALAEMADALDLEGDRVYWQDLLSKLEPPHFDEQQVLMFAKDSSFSQSHRHHSHLMALHPLGLLHPSQGRYQEQQIHSTLNKVEELGTQAWVGYSFSWYACMLARVGRAEQALRYLRDYERAFISRNGFHLNGDQIGAGLSAYSYRPFTLEGNFLAMQAVHEMLLQSWGKWLRVFPAVADEWQDASFQDLRGEGGYLVSAKREDGRTIWVKVTATVPGWMYLKDPFYKLDATSNRAIQRLGTDYACFLEAGESLELSLIPDQLGLRY